MSHTPVLSCEEALKLLAQFLDHELQPSESVGMSEHLERCRSCFDRAEFERRLKGQLASLGRQEISTELELRIRSLLS
ncbi:MAG: anti-sigma factor family protein [Gemmatimonadota bacterium]